MEIYQYGQLQCSYQVGDYLKQHNFWPLLRYFRAL
jgi:hypothetical protein